MNHEQQIRDEDIIDLGAASVETRGQLTVGIEDADSGFKLGLGLSED